MRDRDEPETLRPDDVTGPGERARELYEASLGVCDATRMQTLLELEQLADAHPGSAEVIEALAMAHGAVTEDCCGGEANGSLASLRRLASLYPTIEEPRRQLCYALFNRYCDVGLETYLLELRKVAASLPDRDELLEMAGADDYDADD